MEGRKKYILEKAFEVFMDKGYDSVSITVLQKELEMSRGAMYRHFKSKDELFIAVIDRYFFDIFIKLHPRIATDITLYELIEVIHNQQKIMARYSDRISSQTYFLNYTALAIQAAKYYPKFLDKIKNIQKVILNSWIKAITNSIDKGEIKKDIDVEVLAGLFFKGAMNPEIMSNDFHINFSQFVEYWKRSADYLYNLIKV